MAENDSTPLSEEQTTDTSDVVVTDTSDVGTEPDTKTEEPGLADDKAETSGENPNEELIFGKYKSLEDAEKGYKEAERALTKAAELEKQLQAYQTREAQAREQREIAARERGFSDAQEQEVQYQIASHEFQRYCEALETTLSGDNYTKAYNALYNYQQTGNPQYLEAAKGFFPATVISKIGGDVALYSQKALDEYRGRKEVEMRQYYKTQLNTFAKENADWLASKERQDAVGMLIQLSGGNVDFASAKQAIDALEARAIADFQKKQAETKENQEIQTSLQTPSGGAMPKSGKKWLTREEYNNLTPEQEAANYDLIVEQIGLEKQGKLPRMLT